MSTAIEIADKIKDSWTKKLNFEDNQGSAVISVSSYFGAAVSDYQEIYVFVVLLKLYSYCNNSFKLLCICMKVYKNDLNILNCSNLQFFL